MRKQPKSMLVLAAMAAFLATVLFLPGLIGAGLLDPLADPDDPGSAMYTLEDIYKYLDTGVAGTKRGEGFVEPALPPGSTGRTLDDVHDKISERCITCEGDLSLGGRWCDNEDGTVKDMTTGLVWLQNANCMGWMDWYDAVDANIVQKNCLPSDGSDDGDWRLPTKNELYVLTHGTEAVRSDTPQAFTGVQSDYSYYWSSTAWALSTPYAWYVDMLNGFFDYESKNCQHHCGYVWPVRPDN